eukprot:6184000-Pleurochrysis_carterae.AAC.2
MPHASLALASYCRLQLTVKPLQAPRSSSAQTLRPTDKYEAHHCSAASLGTPAICDSDFALYPCHVSGYKTWYQLPAMSPHATREATK